MLRCFCIPFKEQTIVLYECIQDLLATYDNHTKKHSKSNRHRSLGIDSHDPGQHHD